MQSGSALMETWRTQPKVDPGKAGRRLQNAHTGLDLTVPQHQEVRGKMMSGHVEYQILVVTRLAAFKSAKHRPEDVVQFLVSKKYSEIEEFYQKLSSRYAAASLPLLPRKVLFVGESDIRERRAVFNEILRCVSKDAELAGSPELLEFLGTRSPGAAGLTSRDSSVLDGTDSQTGNDEEAFDFFEQQDQVAEEGPPIQSPKGEDAEESLEEEEALDPLGIMRSKKPKKHPKVAVKAKPLPRLTIFDEEVDPDERLFGPGRKLSPQDPSEDVSSMDPLKLFDDPDLGGAIPLGDSLLLPAACESGGPTPSLSHRDASEELFRTLAHKGFQCAQSNCLLTSPRIPLQPSRRTTAASSSLPLPPGPWAGVEEEAPLQIQYGERILKTTARQFASLHKRQPSPDAEQVLGPCPWTSHPPDHESNKFLSFINYLVCGTLLWQHKIY
ncbi:HCLS1-binding protein 3 isoform X7 [Pan paniscus]|uniref:HCLS1-binding protein 3 isoform X7 n=1 Tax=Pan paniscus TaxID=9597 RepID=UPI002436C2A5|nr:HCLS1-binding protein 3 isoform X6 [Pan paniscus]